MRVMINGARKTPANDDIKIFKGLKNVALTRNFASFLVNDNLALNYLNWLEDANIPDEHFYSTLVRVSVNKVTREVNMTIIFMTISFISWGIFLTLKLNQCSVKTVKNIYMYCQACYQLGRVGRTL